MGEQMKFLLVEDDENKRAQLGQFIETSWPGAELTVTTSFQSGLHAVKEGSYSFIILDMTLPNYDVGPNESGGGIHQLGGKEFLRKMKRSSLKIPTVVVTQYETFGLGKERVDLESIRTDLAREYGGLCVGTIYYNSAIDSWRQELHALIVAFHDGVK
jgi:CheY-like chemotaxis protein